MRMKHLLFLFIILLVLFGGCVNKPSAVTPSPPVSETPTNTLSPEQNILTPDTSITPAGIPTTPPSLNRIVFSSERDRNDEIYVMDADGSGRTQLTFNDATDRQPSWSPDGNKIAFVSDRNGIPHIYIMNADGSAQIQLTSGPTARYAPSWSPDGNKITFYSEGTGENSGIFIINTDGSLQTRLTIPVKGTDEYPAWSPDGKKIAFKSSRDGEFYEIYIMDVDGSNQINLTRNGADGTEIVPNPNYKPSDGSLRNLRIYNKTAISNYSPVWSPDGKEIAYKCYKVEYQNGKSVYQSGEIYVISSDGSGNPRAVSKGPNDAWPSWSPDGNQIAFQSVYWGHNNWQIYIINLDGTGLTRITNNDFHDRYPSWAKVGGH